MMSKPQTFCFISLNPITPWGGSEELWFSTAIRLKDMGYKVCAIYYDWGILTPFQIKQLMNKGVELYLIPSGSSFVARFNGLLNIFFGDYTLRVIGRFINYIKPDLVVHTTMAPRGADVLRSVIKQKIPYVLDIQLADEQLWHVFNQSSLECYNNAQAVFFLSDKNKLACEKQLGQRLDNAKRHYNPINVVGLNFRKLSDISGVHFLNVARMGVEHKRQDLLLEILAQNKWKQRNWVLHFFGGGEHFTTIERLIKYYSIGDKVVLEGQVKEQYDIWSKGQVLLMPSVYEGMSLAVIECMYAGRVPIVTNTGANSELITNGKQGFIAEAATQTLFDKCMEDAWDNMDRWEAIGEAARAIVSEKIPHDPVDYYITQLIQYIGK